MRNLLEKPAIALPVLGRGASGRYTAPTEYRRGTFYPCRTGKERLQELLWCVCAIVLHKLN